MENWFNKEIGEVENQLETNITNGLSEEQFLDRLNEYGYNELKEKKKSSLFAKFMNQFKDFMIIVLLIAAIVSGVIGYMQNEGFTDAIIILVIVILNAIIGVVQEVKAETSLEALKKLSGYSAKVIRAGNLQVVPTKELVPGDVVVLETGDFVPADIRLVESINLKIQEASLTGESVPVEKIVDKLDKEEVPLGDRINMSFSSSMVTYGRGKGIVVETGMNTEVGKIATMLDEADDGLTPLQEKLDALGKTLGTASLVICAVLFVVGWLIYKKEPIHMFMSAVSLAVAAIPEGLPAIATIVLSIGVQRMVNRNAIVRKLPSVETLGSATVICSDKTGTLTQNRMTVVKLYYNEKEYEPEEINRDEQYMKLIYSAVLCNDSKVTRQDIYDDGLEDQEIEITGDPTETALVDVGMETDVFKDTLDRENVRIAEVPFDSERKLMTTIHEKDGQIIAYTKGAVDELLKRCTKTMLDGEIKNITKEEKQLILDNNEAMAKDALRVLGFAFKQIDTMPERVDEKTIENDLVFVGMMGMIDPPRPEVKDAVEECKEAGIRTVMITGDHLTTAKAIATDLGILTEGTKAIQGAELDKISDEDLKNKVKEISVYARVSPEHKVRIVKAWQANGDIVAMTGDGVNDAPSLKTANIGCAMGITGTDVSKEAADVVLTDDNFATVVSAVEEGRRIYDNILKSIQYLISSNIGEIIALFVVIMATPFIASTFNIQDTSLIEPLLPIQILCVNLATDSLPALALSVEPAEEDIMKRKAKKKTNQVFTKGIVWRMIYQGIMIGCLTLAAFFIGMATQQGTGYSEEVRIGVAQTMAFATLAISELVHSFNAKSKDKSIFKTGIFNNMALIGAVAISLILMLLILRVPFLMPIFKTKYLTWEQLRITFGLCLAPLVIVEIFKLFKINDVKEKEVLAHEDMK